MLNNLLLQNIKIAQEKSINHHYNSILILYLSLIYLLFENLHQHNSKGALIILTTTSYSYHNITNVIQKKDIKCKAE